MAPLTYGWLDGTLVSSSALQRTLAECALGADEAPLTIAVRRLRQVHRRAGLRLGPASGPRAVWTHVAAPVAATLGWRVREARVERCAGHEVMVGRVDAARTARSALVAAASWGLLVGHLGRPLCRMALDLGLRRVMVTNGRVWLCRDPARPLGRHHVAFDLDAARTDERVWEGLWVAAHASRDHLPAMADLTVALEAGATGAIRAAVGEARAHLGRLLGAGDAEVLTHLFRWLFLLFAEGRGLVPIDNPIYRQAYALSTIARLARERTPPIGLWDSLCAAARLAHHGSRHPLLAMTALNGALFDPGATPRADRRRVPDTAVAPMLTALTTVRRRTPPTPIAFADLGVEHLGTIYEDVLASGATARVERKRSGSFYTPRDLADHLVAETLGPLTEGRSANEILALRVLDPAAGSGAILASAARHLHAALEAAWARDGRAGPLDLAPQERADAVRRIVEQCLYGVDRHGRAIQIARLSLWLTSMTRERPLTFLDHHLRVGNSLVGTSPVDVVTRAPRADRRSGRDVQPTLFARDAWDRQAAQWALAHRRLAAHPSETAEDVRAKTRRFHGLHDEPEARLWRRRADAWCAAMMRASALPAGTWSALEAHLRGDGRERLPRALSALLAELLALAQEVGCFHWPLEFPDVFHAGGPGGFDAVLANPPWEMLRADSGDAGDRVRQRTLRGAELRFVARSGLYSAGGTAHRNLHQLFAERMLQLCRPGGRIGLIAPWGLFGDEGGAETRRRLLSSTAIDRVTVFDNRQGIFPIHRSVRFVAVTATTGASTSGIAMTLPVTTLEQLHDRSGVSAAAWLDGGLLRACGGRALALPNLRSVDDMATLQQIVAGGARLGEAPWHLHFGRELNATDDRSLFTSIAGHDTLRVLGGRHLRPFGLAVAPGSGQEPRHVRRAAAASRLGDRDWRRWRLGYRDVASPGNRHALIAALIPPTIVTTHTIFVVRQPPSLRLQHYLCGVLNSTVANWFVRRFLATHVTSALMARLPVPVWSDVPADLPDLRSAVCRAVAAAAAHLARVPPAAVELDHAFARLQGRVAWLYGLSPAQLHVVFDGTPRVPAATRAAALDELSQLHAARHRSPSAGEAAGAPRIIRP